MQSAGTGGDGDGNDENIPGRLVFISMHELHGAIEERESSPSGSSNSISTSSDNEEQESSGIDIGQFYLESNDVVAESLEGQASKESPQQEEESWEPKGNVSQGSASGSQGSTNSSYDGPLSIFGSSMEEVEAQGEPRPAEVEQENALYSTLDNYEGTFTVGVHSAATICYPYGKNCEAQVSQNSNSSAVNGNTVNIPAPISGQVGNVSPDINPATANNNPRQNGQNGQNQAFLDQDTQGNIWNAFAFQYNAQNMNKDATAQGFFQQPPQNPYCHFGNPYLATAPYFCAACNSSIPAPGINALIQETINRVAGAATEEFRVLIRQMIEKIENHYKKKESNEDESGHLTPEELVQMSVQQQTDGGPEQKENEEEGAAALPLACSLNYFEDESPTNSDGC